MTQIPTPRRDQPPTELVEWNADLSAALDIPSADVERILTLAGVAAHRIVRPAAPVTTFLVGYATARLVAQGVAEADAFAQATAATEALIEAHGSRVPGVE